MSSFLVLNGPNATATAASLLTDWICCWYSSSLKSSCNNFNASTSEEANKKNKQKKIQTTETTQINLTLSCCTDTDSFKHQLFSVINE